MIFDIFQYSGNYAMICTNQEEAKVFLEYLTSVGRTWCNGKSYQEEFYFKYDENTGYTFNEGRYGGEQWYKDNNYKLLYFADFEWKDDIDVSEHESKKFDKFFSQFIIN